MRILVIEDDTQAAHYLTKGLRESGFVVDHAADGPQGLFLATSETYDAMVVDRMLPGMDGLLIVETIRRNGNQTPVLFLSAMGQVDDRVRGLRAGGDDYLTKPYAFTELLARLEALLRRGAGPAAAQTELQIGDLKMDLLSRAVTRTMLLENVWNYHFDPQTNVIDVHISRLRQKIDRDFDTSLLQTVRGAGYCLRASD